MMNLESALFLLPGLVIGLTVHEASHAISAKWLGDSTSEHMGRISLNPFRHLSAMGTLALFFVGFGWGQPVIVNLYNFKRPKLYYFLSSMAGPVSNLLLCALSLGILYLRPPFIIGKVAESVYFINAILAVINLIPIPPLDGSKIWPCIIPGMRPTVSADWSKVWLAVLLILMFSNALDKIFVPVMSFLEHLLPA